MENKATGSKRECRHEDVDKIRCESGLGIRHKYHCAYCGKKITAKAAAGVGCKNKKAVEWIVNDLAEIGVKIGNDFFFLYKGESYVGGEYWRPVFKREFGECCHPWSAIKNRIGEERLPQNYVGFLGEDESNWSPIIAESK